MPPRASIRHESAMPGPPTWSNTAATPSGRERAHARGDVLAAVVDRDRAERAQVLLLGRAGGADHADAGVAGELHEDRADAARGAEHDDRLRRADPRGCGAASGTR